MVNQLENLINDCVRYYIDIAQNEYPNLSSFAIVTDEGFECFDIAINTNAFFTDMQQQNVCDEDYWNTAEWTEELLGSKYPHRTLDDIYNILTDYNDETLNDVHRQNFLEMCKKALKNIRPRVADTICLCI